MRNNIKMQFRLMTTQKSFILALFVMVGFSCIAFLVNCITVYGRPLSDVPNAYFYYIGSTLSESYYYIFSIILPLIAAFPFADSFYKEYKKNTVAIVLIKTTPKRYYISKLFVVFLSGLLVAFIPLLINYGLNFIVFPVSKGCDFTMFPAYYTSFFEKNGGWIDGILFKDLFVTKPYLYNFLFLILTSVLSGIYAIIVYNISFLIKKQYILIIASAFVITNVLSILAGVFPSFSLKIENYFYAFSKIGEINPIAILIIALLYGFLLFGLSPVCLKKLRNVL